MPQGIANTRSEVPTRVSPVLLESQLRHLSDERLINRLLVPALLQQRGQLLPQLLILIIQICSSLNLRWAVHITTVLRQTG